MRATIKWTGGACFSAEAGTGHTVVMDGPPDMGGENQGARPMEMLLIGLGGCTAFDVVHILRKGRHAVTDCQVEVTAERADTPPKVFTGIHLHYRIAGDGVPVAAIERAIRLSAEKYCSASIMLGKTADITHDFERVPD